MSLQSTIGVTTNVGSFSRDGLEPLHSTTRTSLKGLLQRKCYEILQTVDDPEKNRIMDPELQPTCIAKLKKLADDLKYFYMKPEAVFCPTLSHLNFDVVSKNLARDFHVELKDIQVVRGLVSRIIDPKTPESGKNRAELMLQYLCDIDPFILRLNKEISSFLENGSKPSLARLQHFVADENKPLTVHYSIKPYASSEHSKTQNIAHDFWKVKEMYLSNMSSGYVDNLSEIGNLENFTVKSVDILNNLKTPWLRDPCIRLDSGELLIPHRIPCGDELINLIRSITEDQSGLIMGWIAEKGVSSQLLQSSIQNVKEAPFYFEGGNLIPAINSRGNQLYLSGSHNILFSLLNAHVLFASKKEELLDKMEMDERLHVYTKYKIQSIYEKLEKAGLLAPFSDIREKIFIAKLTFTMIEQLQISMRESLNHPVVFLGDAFDLMPGFHIDLFLAPAPSPDGTGVIYMNDYLMGMKLLEQIYKNEELTPSEERRLFTYYEYAVYNQKAYGNVLSKIQDQLESAHFKVIKVPGICHGKDNQLSMNLLNSVFGIGEKGSFCITNGSYHSIDRYFRSRVVDLLQQNGIDHVYFTGRNSTGEISSKGRLEYREAQDGLNHGGGIRCRVQETAEQLNGKFFQTIPSSPNDIIPSPEKVQEYQVQDLSNFFSEMLNLKMQQLSAANFGD
ncbi:MAG TPA: hypothetical protein VLG49_08255 [Rhabdochlamydiaceae bacterium]|nr:hypothetical protein [Rhabdochlamydiaceae bacterium]